MTLPSHKCGASQPNTVSGVQTLVWEADHGDGYRLFHAQSGVGRFSYGTDRECISWSLGPVGRLKEHANEDQARRSAQADHAALVYDKAKELGLLLNAPAPASPQSSIEYQQLRGAGWDIVEEAIMAWNDFMLDDDYDIAATSRKIMDRMIERRNLYYGSSK